MGQKLKASVTELIKRVREDEDPIIRREALIELGYLRNEEVYPVLLEQLNNPNSGIQHASVISLERFGNPDAIDTLIKPKIYHSPIVNIRWAAVKAVGKLGNYRVINHLLKAVEDPEWIVRNQAVTELKEKIREMIDSKAPQSARVLMRLLALDDAEIIELAIEGFLGWGEECVDLLIDALKSPSIRVRKNAAKALGLMNVPRAVNYLISLLNDPEWQVRRSVVEALGLILDRRAVEPLVQRIKDNVEKVQKEAMKSLIGFGKLSTIPLLNALAHEKNKFVLRAILLTLGEIGDEKSVPALIDHLSSSYYVIRVAAVRALIKFGPRIKDALVSTLSFNDSDIQSLLKDGANPDDPPLQLRAVKALGGLEEHRAVNLLKQLIEEGWPEVQEAAEQALIQIGCAAWRRCGALIILREIDDVSLVPDFIRSLGDDSDNVRLEAVRSLAKIDGSNAIDPLITVARKDRDPYVRFEAVRLLRRIGVGYHQVLELAFSALNDSFRDVRSQAARLLGNFHDDRSIRPLLKATADSHWSVRESAEIALINFGKRAVSQLIDALNSNSWTTRFRAARLLGEVDDRRAIEPLENLLRKKGERKKVRTVVREALQKLQGRMAA